MDKRCLHCDALISLPSSEAFCCSGCNAAYLFINNLKLDKYYDYCRKIYGKKPMKVTEIENNLDYLEYVESREFGENKIYKTALLINGLHCGACVWLIENTLRKQKKITNARVNLSTNRLILEWSDEKEAIHNFIKIIEKLGYKATPFSSDVMLLKSVEKQKDLLKRLAISGAASAQVMMLSVAIWAGNMQASMGEHTRLFLHIIIAIITIPSVIYSGMPFFKSAITAIVSKRSNMDVPISVGAILATMISIQETFTKSEYTYYDAAISLIFVLLIGRYLDLKVRNQANAAAQDLILSQPTSVTIIENDKYKLINVKKALPNQIALITVGERIPIDGIIIDGESEVDNSIVNGETLPLKVSIGSNIFAGSINISGILKVKITKAGDNTTLNEIIKLVENAKQIKSRYINIADKIASFYTPVVFTASLLTFLAWYFIFSATIAKSLLYSVSVLIVTCPCALGLAVPIVQVVAVLNLMKNGILVKSQDALERLANITDIVFDKTGTITYGKPKWLNKDDYKAELLQLIVSIANHSKHPLMQAIIELNHNMPLLKIDVYEEKGMGLGTIFDNEEIRIGNRTWCGVDQPNNEDNYLETWVKYKNSSSRLIFEDKILPEAGAVISELKKEGYEIHLFSGDRNEVVRNVAKKVKINNFKGLLKPEDKYKMIEEMKKNGKKVLMIGDGLNDSPALQIASASMSPSTALAITSNNSDIIFQKDLFAILKSLYIANKSIKLIKQNFILSFIYNVVMVPIAMVGFMTPLIAAATMASSSIMVVLNAMRLTFYKKHEKYR